MTSTATQAYFSNSVQEPNTLFKNDTIYLNAILQRIDQIANEDVEMKAAFSVSSTFMIIDTNVLLRHLEVIKQFVDDIDRLEIPIIVVVPGVVIYELDGQKKRDGLAWFARRASAWLLEKVKQRKSVKCQANEETCKRSGNWKINDPGESVIQRTNDALILDCCMYFRNICPSRTWICSGDNNLCIECYGQGIPAVTPSRQWCSRDIASAMYSADMVDLGQFGLYRESYKYPRSVRVEDRSTIEEDYMNVDDDVPMSIGVYPSHALDLLHIQIVEHFTGLLIELVGRVGGVELNDLEKDGAIPVSRHAPFWRQSNRSYLQWGAAECLDYLGSKRSAVATRPAVEVFLSRPYTIHGARRGQDWSRRDWEVALGGLAKIAEIWEDSSIGESLNVLGPHVHSSFALKLRPTGI